MIGVISCPLAIQCIVCSRGINALQVLVLKLKTRLIRFPSAQELQAGLGSAVSHPFEVLGSPNAIIWYPLNPIVNLHVKDMGAKVVGPWTLFYLVLQSELRIMRQFGL